MPLGPGIGVCSRHPLRSKFRLGAGPAGEVAHPDSVNSKPHDTWMIRVKVANAGELENLMDSAAYDKLIK